MIMWKTIVAAFNRWREERRVFATAEREFREWRESEAAEAIRRALEKEKAE